MKNGFTLIELLVIISIIGVLSTIGLNVFRGATATVRDNIRKQDLRKLSLALEIYLQKNNQYIPGSGTCTNDTAIFYNDSGIAPIMADNKVPHDPLATGMVNGCSYDQLQAAYGSCNDVAKCPQTFSKWNPNCDLNGDGQIDIADFSSFSKSVWPDYCYRSVGSGSSYQLCAKLENSADSDANKPPTCKDTRYNYTIVP